jgi:hypothetical protein
MRITRVLMASISINQVEVPKDIPATIITWALQMVKAQGGTGPREWQALQILGQMKA